MLRTRNKLFFLVLFFCLIPSCFALTIRYNPSSPVSGVVHAKAAYHIVSINFDDGWKSDYDYAVPLLDEHGMKASMYIPTWFINRDGYMSSAEVLDLQNRGFEIGGHSHYHPDFTLVDEARMRSELETCKAYLTSWGLNMQNMGFAYPEGNSNSFTDSVVLEYFSYARNGFTPPYLMSYPTSQKSIPCWADITDGTTVLPTLKGLVDEVVSEGGWMILNFHNVYPHPSPWQPNTPPEIFHAFLDYLQEKGITVLTVKEALGLQ